MSPKGRGELRAVAQDDAHGATESAVLARLLARFDALAGVKGGSLPLEDVAAQYLEEMRVRARRPASMRQTGGALSRIVPGLGLLGAATIADLTRPLVTRWRSARVAAGASHRTANVDVGALAAALNLAVELGQVNVNPLAGLRSLKTKEEHRRREARALSEEDTTALLRAAGDVDRASQADFPRAPLLRALVWSCARWTELVFTTWSDLNANAGLLTLRGAHTKNGKTRTVPLDPDTVRAMLDLRGAHTRVRGKMPTGDVRIFLTARGADWTSDTSNIRRFLHEAMRRAMIPHKDALGRVLHIHALRLTGATRHARNKTPLLTLQKILGHSDPKITSEVYVQLEAEALRGAVLALPRIHLDPESS